MSKDKRKNIGFEVLSENEDQVVFKRVLSANVSSKEKLKREMNLPKVTLSYFDKHDIENLQQIQNEIADQYVLKKDNTGFYILKIIKNFLLR